MTLNITWDEIAYTDPVIQMYPDKEKGFVVMKEVENQLWLWEYDTEEAALEVVIGEQWEEAKTYFYRYHFETVEELAKHYDPTLICMYDFGGKVKTRFIGWEI